jgi:hypothetical protein
VINCVENNESSVDDEAMILKSDIKNYSSSYVWGQMTIWWKQTVIEKQLDLTGLG